MSAIRAGYKQTEAGLIPEDWRVVNIAGEAEMITVGFVGSMAHLFKKKGIPLLRGQDIEPNKLNLSNTEFISSETHKLWNKSALAGGDVVIVRVGASAGMSCVIPNGIGDANAASLVVVRPSPKKLDASFLSQLINSHFGKKQIESLLVGGAQPVINTGTASNFKLALPAIEEQHAIVEALSDADALIESLEQLFSKKRHLKQAAMQELLTGKKRLPEFSGEWEVKRLGELFAFSGGHTASRDQLSTDGHCYLHYGDIHISSKAFIDVRAEIQDIPKLDVPLRKISATSLLGDGDVVFVDASEDDDGTSKHVVILNEENVPFISGLHTIVAKSKSDDLDHGYRRYCFQTRAIRGQFLFYAVGTKVSGISKTNIAKINLSVPSVPEQKAIAAILSAMDAELADLEAQLTKTRAVKQGMMQKLLTGEIRLESAPVECRV